MKKYLFILLLPVLLFSCEGERGLTGDAGKSLEIFVFEGTLQSHEDDELFWTVTFDYYNFNLDECIITVNVKFTNAELWFEPLWYHTQYSVFIIDNEDADPGNEYKITIAQ